MAAADAPPGKQPVANPCCLEWKGKCSKLEDGRKCLREAVKVLTEQVEKIQAENVFLKRALTEEKAKVGREKDGRVALESKICSLQLEISSLKLKGDEDVDAKTAEVKLLESRVSEREKVIEELRRLVEEDKLGADTAKKNAEAEKRSAAEAWKFVKAQKERAEKDRKLANVEAKKTEEYRLKLEDVKKVADEARAKLASQTLILEETKQSLEAEKSSVLEGRKTADLWKGKADKLKKLVEDIEENAKLEKSRADGLALELEDARKRIELLQIKVTKFTVSQNPSDTPGILCNAESNGIDVGSLFENIDKDVDLSDLVLGFLASDDAIKKIEFEKNRAELALVEAEEQRKAAEEYKKLAAVEKLHADRLSLQLEDSLRDNEALQKQIQELLSRGDEVMKKVKLSDKKLNDEKLNVTVTEANHPDSAMKIMEELIPEVNRKLATDEKSCADQLYLEFGKRSQLVEQNQMVAAEEKLSVKDITCQLNEDRKKIEEMQKQIQLLVSPAKSPEVKHLERQLKHEKKRRKFAEQLANTEKSRNIILIHEFNSLKRDFVQTFSRLDVVGRLFSTYADGTNDPEKAAEFALMQSSKLRNSKDFGMCQARTQSEHEILKNGGLATGGCNFHGRDLHSTAPCFPLLDGKVSESISGIDSALEPLVGGSNRQLLQSSAMNSSSASFSDDRLMGSQEKAANVISSPKIGQLIQAMRPKVPAMSGGEVTEVQQISGGEPMVVGDKQCIDVVAKNNAIDQIRTIDPSTSCEILSSGKNFSALGEEKIFKNRSKRKRQSQKYLEDNLLKRGRLLKKTESFHEQNSPVEHLASRTKCDKAIHNGDIVFNDANIRREDSSSRDQAVTILTPCRSVNKHFQFLLKTVAGLEEVDGNNYMRLLDLDNPTEEESYRRAIERPLSPSLPEARLPNADYVGIYGAKPMKGDSSNKGMLCGNQISSSSSLDKIKLDVISKNLKSTSFPSTACEDLSSKDLQASTPYNSSGNFLTNILHNHRSDKSVDKLKPMNVNTSIAKKTAFMRKVGSVASDLPTSIYIFADTKDYHSISSVWYASRNWISHSLETETRSLLKKVLHALKKENISTKEKSSAFFTILMHHMCAYNFGKSGNYCGGKFIQHVDAFAKEIRSALLDQHTRNLLEESFSLNELLATMDNFLTDGRVMTCANPSYIWGEHSPSLGMGLDGNNKDFLCKSASVEQLLTGSIVLASICEATDNVGFICEVSYSLLREHRFDDTVTLIILHIFAHLGREKLFSLKQYLPEMTVLKSIVMLLEGANKSCVHALSSPHDDAIVQFHPMDRCPFSRDVVPIDNLAMMLLEELHTHALFSVESTDSSHCNVLSHTNKSKLGAPHEKFGSWIRNQHDASCGLTQLVGDPSYMVVGHTLCDVCDILSLLELLASRMSWEWTCGVIVLKLLEMLKGPKLDVFAIGILSLLGQLGRIGVGSCGYEEEGVENLRCKVSDFLRLKTTAQVSLPIQNTAASALLGLLTFDARQAVLVSLEKSVAPIQSVYVDVIRSWFSLLDKDQQASTLDLLQAVVSEMQ